MGQRPCGTHGDHQKELILGRADKSRDCASLYKVLEAAMAGS
jgi:hypothetical protein